MSAPEQERSPQAGPRHALPSQLDDPFASPVPHAVDTPSLPKPCALAPAKSPKDESREDTAASANDSVYDRTDAAAYKSASMSSAGNSSATTAMSSIDLEKGSLAREQDRHSRRSAPPAPTDPEKGFYKATSPSSRSARRSQRHRSEDATSAHFSDADSEVDAGHAQQEAHAIKILFYLSGPVVALSWLNFVWTLISLFITTLSQPVRLCARRLSYGQQLASLLGPALNLQLKCIYTPLPPYANEDGVFHTGMLIAVHLVSPVLSMGIAVAAWVVAAYWLMAGMVGEPNPACENKRDDGRETVLGLRGWWEKVLLKGINLD